MNLCISHKEDVDGIASAMLIKLLFNPKSTILVDYGNMIETLEKVASQNARNKFTNIFICDLALGKRNENEFAEIIERFISMGIKVTYIDHHDLDKPIEDKLQAMGVELLHNIEECTSVQIYQHYKNQLSGSSNTTAATSQSSTGNANINNNNNNSHAAFYAAAAALTDYMDKKPVASSLVSRFDRHFLMLESTALSYIISANQHDDPYLVSIVDTLSQGKYTHDIKDGFATALKYATMVGEAAKEIETSMKKLKNLAYASSSSSLSTSMVVNFVLGNAGKPVAVIYRSREDLPGSVQISVRGTDRCKIHLGRAVNEIATELGGNGGGHEKACGAIIPEDRVKKFLGMLNKVIA